jgi:hypothetical protein
VVVVVLLKVGIGGREQYMSDAKHKSLQVTSPS